MSERMIKYKQNLKALARCSSEEARHIIQNGDDDFILAILDAVWTTLANKLELLPEQVIKIRSVQSMLRRFADRGQSVEERRRWLLTQSGIHAIRTLFEILQTRF